MKGYKMKSWHKARMGNDYQGLVIDDITGENIAVTYKAENASLVAAAPDLLQALQHLLELVEGNFSYQDKREAYDAIEKATS